MGRLQSSCNWVSRRISDRARSSFLALRTVLDKGCKRRNMSGSRVTGTFPVNKNALRKHAYEPSPKNFCKHVPVPKQQRSATKSGRAHLVSFASTGSAHLADVEARED